MTRSMWKRPRFLRAGILREGGPDTASRVRFALSPSRPAEENAAATLTKLFETELARYSTDAAAAQKLATEPSGPLPAGVPAAEGCMDRGGQRPAQSRRRPHEGVVSQAIQCPTPLLAPGKIRESGRDSPAASADSCPPSPTLPPTNSPSSGSQAAPGGVAFPVQKPVTQYHPAEHRGHQSLCGRCR